MANELNISSQINYTKDLATMAAQVQNQVTITGQKYCDLLQDIVETETYIDFGDITTPSFVMLQNLSTDDITVQIQTPDVDPADDFPILLKAGTTTTPGGIAMFTLSADATAVSAKAVTTGNWKISVRAFEA